MQILIKFYLSYFCKSQKVCPIEYKFFQCNLSNGQVAGGALALRLWLTGLYI